MDYRFIHPLFTEDDSEAAIEYIAKDMLKSGAVGYIGQDGYPVDPETQKLFNPEMLLPIMKPTVLSLYGPNVVDIANYTIVQNVYLNSFKDSILKYLSDVHVKAYSVDFTPSIVSNVILQHKGALEFANSIITQFHPEKKWDLGYKNPCTAANLAYNICNPLNGYLQSTICMQHLTDRRFIKYIMDTYSMHYDDNFKEAYNSGQPITLNVALTPAKSYVGILRFVQAIHRYL